MSQLPQTIPAEIVPVSQPLPAEIVPLSPPPLTAEIVPFRRTLPARWVILAALACILLAGASAAVGSPWPLILTVTLLLMPLVHACGQEFFRRIDQ